jgi:hypothetical protein
LCCLSFCLLTIVLSVLLSFDHCVVCPRIFVFWLPLWYLKTLLTSSISGNHKVYLIKHNVMKSAICVMLVVLSTEITLKYSWK